MQILLIYTQILDFIYVWVMFLNASNHPGMCKAALRLGGC